MKATFAILALLGMAGTCVGQGTVAWIGLPPWVSAQTNCQYYSPLFGGAWAYSGNVGYTANASSGLTYYFELLYTSYNGSQATIDSLATLLSWNDTGLSATNGNTLAGRLRAVNPNTAAAVPWAYGTTNSIVLVGWSSNLGTSWAMVSNKLANWDDYLGSFTGLAYFGVSATGYITPGTSNPGVWAFGLSPAPQGLPIYGMNTQLYLLPVPEPGTLALVVLGGLPVLMFRRLRE